MLAPNLPIVVLGTISSAVVNIADDDQGEDGIYTALVSRTHPISCLQQRTCLFLLTILYPTFVIFVESPHTISSQPFYRVAMQNDVAIKLISLL